MIAIIFYLIVAFFVGYIVSAFFEKSAGKEMAVAGEKEDLRYRKEEVLGALNDLEYDFKMKKMTEADYLQIKAKLSAQAVEIMKKLDELEGKSLENAASSGSARDKIRS